MIRMEVVEELEREKRRDKLVIMGIPEEGEDGGGVDIVKDVIHGLLPGVKVNFTMVGRIGRKVEGARGPRPVRIRVEDAGHRVKLLVRAKDLKTISELSGIYISPDLTKEQQVQDKKLRDEVKKLRGEGEVGVRISKGVVIRGLRGTGGSKEEEDGGLLAVSTSDGGAGEGGSGVGKNGLRDGGLVEGGGGVWEKAGKKRKDSMAKGDVLVIGKTKTRKD